ncbi:MAG TPA: hypothetical protein VJ022_03645 [Anaerolineales bacterium]|nr:hypothetical protein [Anaerolineales bacterium]
MKILFKKTVLIVLTAALALAGIPLVSVSAAGANDLSVPPQGELTNERLERICVRQLRAYEKMGRTEEFVERAQRLIDRASQNGKDISAIQAALDAFEDAVKDAKPVYESARGIINSHQGFDAEGKVTDPEKAKETVKQMGDKLKEIRDAMGGTGKALHDALRAFREANPRPEKTPTP